MKNYIPYFTLMRLHRPVGIFLLGWPTLMALWLASHGSPDPQLIVIFSLGIIVMRSLGCVINDLTDRPFDGSVQRTQLRPLVTGSVSPKQAFILCGILALIALILVALTTWETFLLSLVALILTIIYPWMKRVLGVPQLVLGLAFSWAIPMAYMAQSGHLPLSCWLLFIANIFWTMSYDTVYAMADKEDDLKIGVKSMAIFFGSYDTLAVTIMQIVTLVLLILIGSIHELNIVFYLMILAAFSFTLFQYQLIKNREPQKCISAFSHHQWLGAILFLGILLG